MFTVDTIELQIKVDGKHYAIRFAPSIPGVGHTIRLIDNQSPGETFDALVEKVTWDWRDPPGRCQPVVEIETRRQRRSRKPRIR